jgi:hypothetical protein
MCFPRQNGKSISGIPSPILRGIISQRSIRNQPSKTNTSRNALKHKTGNAPYRERTALSRSIHISGIRLHDQWSFRVPFSNLPNQKRHSGGQCLAHVGPVNVSAYSRGTTDGPSLQGVNDFRVWSGIVQPAYIIIIHLLLLFLCIIGQRERADHVTCDVKCMTFRK